MATKTQFAAILNLLNNNKSKKVATILKDPAFLALVETKVRSTTAKYDANGQVTHIFCYYHKEWEEVATTPYGKKASTKHGLNTMCKAGASAWTKQQRVARELKEETLQCLLEGLLTREECQVELERIEENRKAIIPLTPVEVEDTLTEIVESFEGVGEK